MCTCTDKWSVASALESPPSARQEGAQEVDEISHKLASGDHQHIHSHQGGTHTGRR